MGLFLRRTLVLQQFHSVPLLAGLQWHAQSKGFVILFSSANKRCLSDCKYRRISFTVHKKANCRSIIDQKKCFFLNRFVVTLNCFLLRKTGCILVAVLLTFSLNKVKAQSGLCPPNMDFEFGDFTNWDCATGTVAAVGGKNVITWTGTTQVPGQHTIIPARFAGTDWYGDFPRNCPNGSGHSVQLGNNQGGAGAEKITYTYTIPSTLTFFSILFHYAVVLQNPNHNVEEQPRFRANITDITTGNPIPCATFDFAASGGLPGFRQSSVDPSVIYKDWTPITVNLNEYIGRTIQIEFITSDCTFSAHFGYAYVDVNSNCNNAIAGTTICQGNNSTTLTAPYGFQAYEWYSNTSFSTLLATTQTLPLNPAPAVGTIYPVIVFPYPNYGCRDTLYATITVSPKPVSDAGPDKSICKYQSVQIGVPDNPLYMYSWTPVSQVSDPLISNPVVTLGSSTVPTKFFVKTTDVLTGCFSFDSVIISPIIVDTAIRLTGNAAFCDERAEAVVSVNNLSATVQWFNSAASISGATSFSYQPTVSGLYWAQLTERGCTDTTAGIQIVVHPLPQASFNINNDTLCVTNNSFSFTNTSSVSNNSPMTSRWNFSDGSFLQTTDAIKNFPVVGMYGVELVTTTAFGCKDSIDGTVYVLPNGTPDFKWDSVCTDRPVLFRNLSNENGSAYVQYNWNFNNGGPNVLIKDPTPVTYTTSGIIDVILQMTTLGCETDPQTITKKIGVNQPVVPVRYKDITVPLGETWPIHVRDTVGNTYAWRPRVQLSGYDSPYTQFFATGNDVQYLIDITGTNTCVTTDTLLMQVLKKPGHYLPTAFTPNGDGLNDLAIPYLIGMKSLKSFSVFNRWGNRVFYTEKYGQGWDGKYNGLEQYTGMFVWVLQYYDVAGKLITAKGTITVIR